MIRLIFLLILIIPAISFSQSVLPLRADTVRIEKINGSAELHLRNATRDSLGVLTNIGNGRTRFLKSRRFGDTLFIGKDTILNARKVDTLYKDGDSIRFTINGSAYAFLGGGGSFTLYNALGGTGDSLVNGDQEIKWLNTGFGLARSATGTTVTHRADTTQLETVWAAGDSVRVLNDFITPRRLKIQARITDSIETADAVSAIKLNDGRILAVYQGMVDAVDLSASYFYYSIWDGRVWSTPVRLFPDGFVAYNNFSGPHLYRMPNGDIGLLFHGFNSITDNPFFFTKTSAQSPPFTWDAAVAFHSPSVYCLAAYDRVIKASDGKYYFPFSQNTNGIQDNQTGNYVGRYATSADGSTWTVASTILTGGPDSLVSEPGIYETSENIQSSYGYDTKKLVFYWRNRAATVLTRDSLFGDSGFDYVRSLGVSVPNSTTTIKYHNRRLYLVANKLSASTTNQDAIRKELALWASDDNGQSFQQIKKVDGNYDDSTAFHEGTLFFDDTTAQGNLYLFYTSILKVSAISELYVKKYPATSITGTVQDFVPKASTFSIIGGQKVATGDNTKLLTIYQSTTGYAAGHFAFGSGSSNDREFLPYMETKSNDVNVGRGTEWRSYMGLDNAAGYYSSPFSFNGKSNSGGTINNAYLSVFANNSVGKLYIHKDGAIQPEAVDSTAVPFNKSVVYWDSATHKLKRAVFPSSGVTTLAALTDVSLSSPANGEVLTYNGSVWENQAASSGTASYGDGLQQFGGGLVRHGRTTNTTGAGDYDSTTYLKASTGGLSLVYDNWTDVQFTGTTNVIVGGYNDGTFQFNTKKTGGTTYWGISNDDNNTNTNIIEMRKRRGASYNLTSGDIVGQLNFNTNSQFGGISHGNGSLIDINAVLYNGSSYVERFRITAEGTVKIGTFAYGANIDPRGLYVDRSIGANKDSITKVTVTGVHEMLVQDTTTGQFHRATIGSGADGNGLYGGNGGAGGDGSLPGATTITGAGNTLTLTGTQSSNSAFNVTNTGNGGAGAFSTTGTGTALTGANSSSGNGVLGTSSSGNGISATSVTGRAIRGRINPSSTNTVVHVLDLIRGSSGTAAAGLGGGVNFHLEDDAGNDVSAVSIYPEWTSAATGATSADFKINTVSGGSSTNKFILKAAGQLKLTAYTTGAFTGTPTDLLASDADGDVVQATPTQINALLAMSVVAADPDNWNAAVSTFTTLPSLAGAGGSKTVTLPSAASNTGKTIILHNVNADANLWSFAAAITLANGTTTTAFGNGTLKTLFSNGSVWIQISSQ